MYGWCFDNGDGWKERQRGQEEEGKKGVKGTCLQRETLRREEGSKGELKQYKGTKEVERGREKRDKVVRMVVGEK